MAWIESHQSLLHHRKTGRLARRLGISKITAIGHLHAFWWWCMDNAPDGELTDIDDQDIAEGSGWEGDPTEFVQALIFAGFIDGINGTGHRCVHDWDDYGGKLLLKRKSDAERKRADRRESRLPDAVDHPTDVQRTSNGRRSDGARTVPNRTVPNITEQEEVVVDKSVGGAERAPQPTPAPKARAARGTPAPDTFPITDEMQAWADERCPDVDLIAETERFLNRARSKGETYKDWPAAWRNWMTSPYAKNRNAPARAAPDFGGNGYVSREQAKFERSLEALRHVGERH
jgi:hypothetical protein